MQLPSGPVCGPGRTDECSDECACAAVAPPINSLFRTLLVGGAVAKTSKLFCALSLRLARGVRNYAMTPLVRDGSVTRLYRGEMTQQAASRMYTAPSVGNF